MWKLNTLHLHNSQFVEELNNQVEESLSLLDNLSPDHKWESLKNDIQKFCMQKSKMLANEKSQLLNDLYNKAAHFQGIIDNGDTLSVSQQLEQQQINAQIQEILEQKAKGCLLRCKMQWYGFGQRSSKYFFSLEKSKANKKRMTMPQDEQGRIISDQDKILEEQVMFYQKLYTSNTQVNFHIQIPDTEAKINQEQKEKLDSAVDMAELTQALFAMPNNKTPGCDGLPAELYKILWPQIGQVYFQMIEYSVELNLLPKSTKRGVITLMPKKDKNVLFLKNWRSLTMLNVDYKIFAKALANRLKMVLPTIIDKDQTGFMAGRNIISNIRRSMEIMEYAKKEQLPCVLASVDYEKCFYRIEHCAIWGALEQYNFGYKFFSMVRTLFTSLESCITSNGYTSRIFPITRSIQQGSPISSFLFLITGQLLNYMLKNDVTVKGIHMNNYDHIISQFADDTDLYLMYDQKSLNQVLSIFNILESNIGLKVNYDKTTLYRMGSLKNTDAKLYTMRSFNWINEPPNILGINIVEYDDNAATLANFEGILDKAQAILYQWSNRNLSFSGKVMVVNTLISSLFIYKMSVLPNVPYRLILQFEEMISKYLGNGRKCRIPLSVLELPRCEGGLKLVNLFKRQMSLKAQWVVMIRDDEQWAHIAFAHLDLFLLYDVFRCNIHIDDINNIIPSHSFWKQVLYAWCVFNVHQPDNVRQILGQIIWYNSNIKVDGKVLRNNQAWRSGLKYVKDLYSDVGLLLTHREVCYKYGNCITWYGHIQLINALPHRRKEKIIACHSVVFDAETQYDRLTDNTKISNIVYNKLVLNPSLINDCILKWQRRLNETIELQEMFDAFQAINA